MIGSRKRRPGTSRAATCVLLALMVGALCCEPGVKVELTPATADVLAGGTQQFTATVTGAADTAVTWSVVEPGGGTVSPTGLYSAPIQAGTWTVRAVSKAKPSAIAEAKVTVAQVTVTMGTPSTTLFFGEEVTLTAQVQGAVNTAITWSVEGGEANGQVSSSGVYVAPKREGTFRVLATSDADPSRSAATTIQVARPVPAFAASLGGAPDVKEFQAGDLTLRSSFLAYPSAVQSGVRIAKGDVNGDGHADLITGPGPGYAPNVKVFNGRDGTLLHSFLAGGTDDIGGVHVAAADFTGDGKADLVVSVGATVKVLSGTELAPLMSFLPYGAPGSDIRVATGEISGSGVPEILTTLGEGWPPILKAFSYGTAEVLLSYDAYAPTETHGVYVAAGDLDADGTDEIVVGRESGLSHVKVFRSDGVEMASFFAFGVDFAGGVRVACGDVNDDGRDDLILGAGATTSAVKVLSGVDQTELANFLAFGSSPGGVYVSGTGF